MVKKEGERKRGVRFWKRAARVGKTVAVYRAQIEKKIDRDGGCMSLFATMSLYSPFSMRPFVTRINLHFFLFA